MAIAWISVFGCLFSSAAEDSLAGVARAILSSDDVEGNDEAADDSDDADDDDDTVDRTALQFSNTAHLSMEWLLAVSLGFFVLLFRFRFISVLCELEKYDVNFFNTPAWALLSIGVWSPSMVVVTVVDDSIDVIRLSSNGIDWMASKSVGLVIRVGDSAAADDNDAVMAATMAV